MMGHSMGGIMTLSAGYRDDRIKKLVAISAPYDMLQMFQKHRTVVTKFIYKAVTKFLKKDPEYLESGMSIDAASRQFYLNHPDQKDLRKGLAYMNLSGGRGYKELDVDLASQGLVKFYTEMQKGKNSQKTLEDLFWKNANYSASTFIKFFAGKTRIKAEIYRDDGRGGEYTLKKTLVLNK